MKSIYLLRTALLCGGIIAGTHASAQLIGTDAFMRGQYMEVGSGILGAYGTGTTPPAGYHANSAASSGISGIGFVADPAMDGWTVGTPAYMGDYFLPGSPFEGWELQVNGSRAQAFDGISTAFTFAGTITSGTGSNISYGITGSVVSSVWQGMLDSIQVTQTTSFDTNSLYFNIKVVLTNLAVAPKNDIYYLRTLDPDNDVNWPGGGFVTTNVIEHQSRDTTVVSAVGATGPISYMALGTTDTNSTAVIYNDWPLKITEDLANIHNQTYTGLGSYYTQGSSSTADAAIGVVTYIPHLATVDSATDSVARTTSARHLANTATFSYFYAFGKDATDSAIKDHLFPKVTPNPALAVKNEDIAADIKAYPNPAKGIVSLTGLSAGDRITVYNMMGQAALDSWQASKEGTNAFSVNSIASGMYIIVVTDNSGAAKSRIPLRKL